MIIDGIDYVVRLFVDDRDGKEIVDRCFSDFSGLNKYIQDQEGNSEFIGCKARYTFAEIINGEPEAYSWTADIPFRVLSEKEIEHEIAEYIEMQQSFDDLYEKIEKDKGFRLMPDMYASGEKERLLSEITYACPHCMYELSSCKCFDYPYYLVQIDKKILPIIRELNQNGYITTGCCALHPRKVNQKSPLYIAFDKEYDFGDPFPEGGKYSVLKHTISYEPPAGLSVEELEEFQRTTLDALYDWAEMLMPVKEDEED